MARTKLQLSDEDTIEILAIFNTMHPTLDGLHGPGFFANTPFQALRAKFPRDDDSFSPSTIEIDLTDIELAALKEALEMSLLMSGNTSNPPVYGKIVRAIEMRTSTLVGRLSLNRAMRRAEATGRFGLIPLKK